jgi:hypothetical protein
LALNSLAAARQGVFHLRRKREKKQGRPCVSRNHVAANPTGKREGERKRLGIIAA